MIYLILVRNLFVPPLPILLVLFKIDNIFLIQQGFWKRSAISLCSIIPCVVAKATDIDLTTLFFIVISKFVIIYLWTLSLLTKHVRNYCKTLDHLQDRFSHNLLLKYYFRVLVFIRSTDQLTSDLMFYFIMFGQLLLLLYAWAIVHCKELLPIFITTACVAFCVGGLILSIFILRVAAYVQAYSSQLVDVKRTQCFGHGREKRRYYFTAKWGAYKKAWIGFGSRFVITLDSINVNLEVLTNNIIDAVLLIVP